MAEALAAPARGTLSRYLPQRGPVLAISTGTLLASLAMNSWIPFLPLYMQDLGAGSDARALFWAGLATTVLGIARLVSGPAWGLLSDRVGRKAMYVRALAFASLTTLIAAFATEPWHLVAAYACQGLFSGFIPAAVALTSVTVEDHRLNSALGSVTAAQYLGSTIGPAAGAVLAIAFGFRGAIVVAATLPAVAALAVYLAVAKDHIQRAARTGEDAEEAPGPRLVNLQFALAVGLYFAVFAIGQLVRLSVPVSLKDVSGQADVKTLTGVAFTLAGLASVAGVWSARRAFFPGSFARSLAIGAIATGAVHALLALAPTVPPFVALFAVASLGQAALIPATNTLIAGHTPRNRRGTAFGIASSAQALAFIAGPMAAAAFGAFSVELGYLVVGALFVGLGAAAWFAVREPASAAV